MARLVLANFTSVQKFCISYILSKHCRYFNLFLVLYSNFLLSLQMSLFWISCFSNSMRSTAQVYRLLLTEPSIIDTTSSVYFSSDNHLHNYLIFLILRFKTHITVRLTVKYKNYRIYIPRIIHSFCE